MLKILFVCHGNICRSPMAEFIMKKLVRERGLADRFEIASAAVSAEELGNAIYPPARRELAAHGVPFGDKRARQMRREDYERWDYLVCMDRGNLRAMQRIAGGDPEGKMDLLMHFAGQNREVDDPYYCGNFSAVYDQIEAGCRAMLAQLAENGGKN